MTKYKCECLNVTLHVKAKSVREANGEHFVTDAGGFFAGDICEVELAVAGITKEVASLVCQSRLEDWDIVTCMNCGIATHALHAVKAYDRVLISKALENNEAVLKQKSSSPKFSSLFKIIMIEPVEGSETSDGSGQGGAVLLGQKTLSSSMTLVEEQFKKYLKAEEEAMEDKIRKVVEKEKQAFAAIQNQALKDKRAIHSVLAKAEEKALQTSLHEAMAETSRNPIITPNIMLSPDHWDDEGEKRATTKEAIVNHVHITQAPPKRIPNLDYQDPLHHKPRRRQQKFLQKNTSVADSDAMFALDGFTDDCEPFFESEEDDLSSDNSFQNEESNYSMMSSMAIRGKQRTANYSSSVPIHKPAEHKPSNPWNDDDDDEFAIPEPSQIGESMKALAQSLQDSVFGELPRPRLKMDPTRATYR